MGGRRVVRLNEAQNSDTAGLDAVLEVANDGDALLVVTSASLGPRDSLRKLFEAHPGAAAIACYLDGERELEQLVRRELARSGIEMDRGAMEVLLARLGSDRALVRREIEKLILYSGGQPVSAEEVQALIGDASDVDFDDLAFAVFSGEQVFLDQAIDRIFAAKGNPVNLLAAVTRHAHRLHLVAAKIARGSDREQAVKTLRPPVFFKRMPQFQGQIRSWSVAKLSRALEILMEAEKMSKTTGMPAETLCRRALLRIAAAAR